VFQDSQIVSNRGRDALEVWFEPWGMPHLLAPGESLRVVGQSPHAGQLEVDASGGTVAVYAWVGATLRVYQAEALIHDFSGAVPELPPGMSTRSFVEQMFGGSGGKGGEPGG